MSEAIIGSRKQIRNMFTSDEAFEKATTFKPKPRDCFVATPPKTGTTLLQFACHLLRSANDSDNGNAGCRVFKRQVLTKIERFFPKNEYTSGKSLHFENWFGGKLSKIGHHFTR